ncbi:MAG: signal recognition particle protein [Bryobacterales bacterium]|nr:signal recognition particle protein [Bryobacterales bacterium]
MFESLSERLQRTFKHLRGQGKLSEQNVQDGLREIRVAMLEADVSFPIVKQFIASVRKKALGQKVLTSFSPTEQLFKIVRDELVAVLGTGTARLRRASRPPSVVLMVGLQGSGKTTSTGKLALWLSKQRRTPLMVSVDVHRPAAREQLAIIAGQIGQPIYRGGEGESTPLQLALGALRDARQTGRDTVLVDTAGRLHLDDQLMGELEELKAKLAPAEILFVADAMTGQDAVRSAAEFHDRLAVTGVVLTKLDGDARGGAALSIRRATGCPIKFIGTGEKPRALEVFHPDRIVSRLLGMGDMLTLIEKFEREVDEKQAREMERRMRTDQFTMEDFRKQIRQVTKVGSLRSMLDMLPSGGPFQQLRNAEIDPKEISRTEAIINSMTAKERSNVDLLNGSRRRRIAAGSGTTVQQVNQVVKKFRMTRDMLRGAVHGGPGGFSRRKGSNRKRAKRRRKSRRRRYRARPAAPGGMDLGKLLGR